MADDVLQIEGGTDGVTHQRMLLLHFGIVHRGLNQDIFPVSLAQWPFNKWDFLSGPHLQKPPQEFHSSYQGLQWSPLHITDSQYKEVRLCGRDVPMILWREPKPADPRLPWDIWSQLKSSISVQSFAWEGKHSLSSKTEWAILKWFSKLSRSPGVHWSTFLSPALQEWFSAFLLLLSLSAEEKNSVGLLALTPVARGGHSHYQHMLVTPS